MSDDSSIEFLGTVKRTIEVNSDDDDNNHQGQAGPVAARLGPPQATPPPRPPTAARPVHVTSGQNYYRQKHRGQQLNHHQARTTGIPRSIAVPSNAAQRQNSNRRHGGQRKMRGSSTPTRRQRYRQQTSPTRYRRAVPSFGPVYIGQNTVDLYSEPGARQPEAIVIDSTDDDSSIEVWDGPPAAIKSADPMLDTKPAAKSSSHECEEEEERSYDSSDDTQACLHESASPTRKRKSHCTGAPKNSAAAVTNGFENGTGPALGVASLSINGVPSREQQQGQEASSRRPSLTPVRNAIHRKVPKEGRRARAHSEKPKDAASLQTDSREVPGSLAQTSPRRQEVAAKIEKLRKFSGTTSPKANQPGASIDIPTSSNDTNTTLHAASTGACNREREDGEREEANPAPPESQPMPSKRPEHDVVGTSEPPSLLSAEYDAQSESGTAEMELDDEDLSSREEGSGVSGGTMGVDDYERGEDDGDAFGVDEPGLREEDPEGFAFDDDSCSRRSQNQRAQTAAAAALATSIWSMYEMPTESKPSSNPRCLAEQETARQRRLGVPPMMTFVDHLTRHQTDEFGRPEWYFTVYGDGGHDDVIYDCRLNVRESSIPGGGNGVFFTFLGARMLNQQSQAKGRDAILAHRHQTADTKEELHARFAGGYGATVRLTGENLHGNNNMDFWPNSGDSVNPRPNASGKYIGFLNMHTEADYFHDPTIVFNTRENSILLGRYGPCRRDDRKPDPLYQLKNFVFSNKPAEYAFAVSENLSRRIQVVDITDETTGTPHNLAKSMIMMYVNETGLDTTKIQNVRIGEAAGRIINYYFVHPTPLRKGETVELFTNYAGQYEEVRERHGYGMKNLSRREKNDDCLHRRLWRNNALRELVEQLVINRDKCELEEDLEEQHKPMTWSELVDMVEFFCENVWKPLVALLDDGSTSDKFWGSLQTPVQWVAIRRLQWLGQAFLHRTRADKTKDDKVLIEYGYPLEKSLEYCRDMIDSMRIDSLPHFLTLDGHVQSEQEKAARAAIQEEMLKEICFPVRYELSSPFDPAMWCPLSRNLVEDVCKLIAPKLIAEAQGKNHGDGQNIVNGIYDAAASAASVVRAGCDGKSADHVACLAFEGGLDLYNVASPNLTMSLQQALSYLKTSSSFFLDYSATPKAIQSAVVEKLAYIDALVAAGVAPTTGDSLVELPLQSDCDFFMVKCAPIDEHEGLRCLGSVPRLATAIERTASQLNELWYVVWQIAYPVHCIADFHLSSDTDYSMEALCSRLGIDIALVKFAERRSVRKEKKEEVERFLRPSRPWTGKGSTKKKKQNGVGSPSGGARPKARLIYEGKPDGDLGIHLAGWPAGWTMRTFQRQSGGSKGDFDRYWYTPKCQKKLRSGKEIERFLKILAYTTNGDDEEEAWRVFKGR